MKNKLDKITPQKTNFAKWYTDVVKNGNLASYGITKGTIFFKPNSYGIWENIQNELNKIFKKNGINNVYLPMLIPESEFSKEKEHIEGFAPELVTVTKVGSKNIDPLVLRPTSEILFDYYFKKEIKSHNDLPLLLNQWANVIRWEKTTNPFLRNTEFLWQEGHTAHSNKLEAKTFALKMINIYADFCREFLAIEPLVGKKTEREKFSGAEETYCIETMMKDHKALQAGTSHFLGNNFAKVLDVKFRDKNNKDEFIYQSSWGVSTRLIGAIIMMHGDDRGIIIPPKIAPNQIDLIGILENKNIEVQKTLKTIHQTLNSRWRVRKIHSNKSYGFNVSQSEIEGTPLRIEVGPRDLKEDCVTIVRRDNLVKKKIKLANLIEVVDKTLKEIQEALYKKSQKLLLENTVEVNSYNDLKKEIKNKFVLCPFDGSKEDEEKIQSETSATVRCIPFNLKISKKENSCIWTKKPTSKYVIFAKAY